MLPASGPEHIYGALFTLSTLATNDMVFVSHFPIGKFWWVNLT